LQVSIAVFRALSKCLRPAPEKSGPYAYERS